QLSPYVRMSSMIGSSARPFSVSAYSTRGGTSGKVWRSTIACSSSARRRSDSVRGLIPASDLSSSQKREWPSASSRTRSRVHFPHTISAVLHTGHVESTAISTNTLPTEVLRHPRRAAGELGRHGPPAPRSSAEADVEQVLGAARARLLGREGAASAGGDAVRG